MRAFITVFAKLYSFDAHEVPETMYHRHVQLPGVPKSATSEKDDIEANENSSTATIPPRKKSYAQELKVYNGVHPTKASVWNLLGRPFVACLTPVCLWAGLVYRVAITWLVLIATAVAQLFSAPRKCNRAFVVF